MAREVTAGGSGMRAGLLCGLVLIGLVACKTKRDDGADAASQAGGADGTAVAATPIKAESLQPVITPLGPDGALPARLVFEFSRPVVGNDALNSDLDGDTKVTLSPRLAGTARFTGPSTLAFIPSEPLAFDTEYTVTLESVEAATGVVKAPSAGAWRSTFRTPSFGFLRHALESVNVATGQLAVSLFFSGPVDAGDVRKLGVWQLDGTPIREVKVSSSEEPSLVRVTLTDSRLKGGRTVRFFLKSGLTSTVARSLKAAQADASFVIPEGKRLDITSSVLREGATGFYVEVGCRDMEPGSRESRSDETEYDGEEGGYYWGEKGCELDDAAALEGIRFEPAVKLSVAPGRRGFRVFGDFKRGSYTMTVAAGTSSLGGATLYSAYSKAFTVPARRPQLAFGASGRYLPRSAWRNLAVSHLNLDGAELVVRQVPPENLIFWMGDDHQEAASERTSNIVHRRPLTFAGGPDTLTTTYVDVGSSLPATTRGVLELTVQNGGAKAVSRLLLTDMSLVAKRTPPSSAAGVKESVWVWALGMDTTELQSGVEVSLVRKSGQTVARCTTSGDNGCRMEVPEDAVDPSRPFALIARKGDDLTYLRYSDLKTEISESDV